MPYPVGFSADISKSLDNQVNYLLLSNCGRVVWSDAPFRFEVAADALIIEGESEIRMHLAGETLRDAVLFSQRHIYPQKKRSMPAEFFDAPQFNTWIELIYNQNQNDILDYARSIVREGYPAGILMIDDSWQYAHGIWQFRADRFPDPKKMINELHRMGFKIMLWVSPFVSPDTTTFMHLSRNHMLVRKDEQEPAIIRWWDGYSGVLDLSNPAAAGWFREQLDTLMQEYHVDGFKFDGGAPSYYPDHCTYFAEGCSGFRQTQLFCSFAEQYVYNELRETMNQPELACAERLRDKSPAWAGNGLDTLIPNSLAQSLMGYSFICPDMIGGGIFSLFQEKGLSFLDEEMVVRSAQASALLPMMQFSAAPWRVLSQDNARLCLEAALLHQRFAPYIRKTVEHCLLTGEPVLRSMEYMWPKAGYAAINSQFMLGDRYLIAPVLEKGVSSMDVILPAGVWRADDGTVINGGKVITIQTPMNRLPYFERCDG